MTGSRTRTKIVKNKVSPPFKQAEFDIMYGKGICREGSLLDVGVELGLIKKSGAWFTYEGEQLGQGRENAKTFLTENPEILVEIDERIRSQVGVGRPAEGECRCRRRRRRRHRPRRPDLPRRLTNPSPPHGGQRRSLARRVGRLDGSPPLLRAHLRVPDERARLRAHRRPARGRRAGAGGLGRRRRRGGAQHLLHPRERRHQALRPPRPPQVREGPTSRPPDRRRRLPGPEGPRHHPRAGAPRRRGLRHPQRPPGHGPARAGPHRRTGHGDLGGDRPRGPRRVPVRAARAAGAAVGRLGHHPDRLRQHLRLLHRPRRAGQGDQPPVRRRRGRGRRGRGRRGQRGHAAGPERQQLRPRPHPAPAAVRRPAAGHGRRRGHPPGALHQPPPQGPPSRDHRRHGLGAGGVRAPAPAAPVRQRPRPGPHAPRLHRRALPHPAGRGPGRRRRPRRHHRPHRRLPRRDRRRLRAHARGRGRGRLRQRLHVHLQPAPGHRGGRAGRRVRPRRGGGRALRATAGGRRALGPRPPHRPRRPGRGGPRRGAQQARPRGRHRPHPSEQARALPAPLAHPRRLLRQVAVTGAAPTTSGATSSRSPRRHRHRTRIPVAAG